MIPQNDLMGKFGKVVEVRVNISVDKLIINTKPYSRGIEPKRLRERKRSLQEHGWFPNMNVTALTDYSILDGNHRVQGLKELGYTDLEIPTSIVEPKDYVSEAAWFMLLNQDSPVLSSLAWWRGMKEAGDVVANTIWTLDSDPESKFYGKVRITDSKKRPFTPFLVADIIKYIGFDSLAHYNRNRHQSLIDDINSVSYAELLKRLNKYVEYVERSFEVYDLKQNPVPYESRSQRGIMRFYVIWNRHNDKNNRKEWERLIKKSSELNMRIVKRDGLSIEDISRRLIGKWNEGLWGKNRIYLENQQDG